MTNKERTVQRALGLLNTYCFVVQVPLVDGRESNEEFGVQIEATNVDSACIQLEAEMKRKYPFVINVTIDKTNAHRFGIK